MFFIDFEGHSESAGSKRALEVLNNTSGTARVLGCYGADRLAPTALELDAAKASA